MADNVEETWESTTYADAAEYIVEAALDEGAVAVKKPKLENLSSLDNLYTCTEHGKTALKIPLLRSHCESIRYYSG
jgi:hypothetical protein